MGGACVTLQAAIMWRCPSTCRAMLPKRGTGAAAQECCGVHPLGKNHSTFLRRQLHRVRGFASTATSVIRCCTNGNHTRRLDPSRLLPSALMPLGRGSVTKHIHEVTIRVPVLRNLAFKIFHLFCHLRHPDSFPLTRTDGDQTLQIAALRSDHVLLHAIAW
jgi:hypothetical protein